MKKTLKRGLSYFIALTLCASLFVSCNNELPEQENTSAETDNESIPGELINEKASEGLEFVINIDRESYGVRVGNCSDAEIIIPSSYCGLPVTEISSTGFSERTNITRVTIPNSVTNIGFSAFYGCINLTKVILSENLKTITFGVFLFFVDGLIASQINR